MIRRAFGRSVALAVLLGIAARAEAEATPRERVAAAKRRLAADLVGVAQWAVGGGVDARRAETLQVVLELDPDSADARRALGWRRRKDEPWTAPPPAPPPVDTRPGRVPLWRERWDAAFATFRDAALPVVDPAAGAPDEVRVDVLAWLRRGLPHDDAANAALACVLRSLGDPAVSADAVESLDDLLERRFPDDETVRSARGHARRGDAWVLEESVHAAERRRALAARAKQAVDAAPAARRDDVRPAETAAGLEDLRAFVADGERAVGTVDDETLASVARHLAAADSVAEVAFGTAAPPIAPSTSWQVKDLAQARQVVARAFRGEERLLEEMAAYSSLPFGATELVWSAEGLAAPWRVDCALFGAQTRRVAAQHGLGARYAAFSEGLVRYLVWRQAGTRLSANLDRSYADPLTGAHIGALGVAGFDWAKATSALLDPLKNRGMLRLALGKRIDSQTPSDAVCCYAFACYLFEGHDGAAARLATRLGRDQNDDVDAAFREVLGRRIEQVERRLSRWCREVGP